MAEETASGTDLVPISDAEVEKALRGEQVALAIEDPQKVSLSIIERILASESADQILAGQTAISGREVLDRPFVLHGVRWHKSRFDEGLPVFAVLDAEFMDDGSRSAVTTSAGNVMAQAYALVRLGDGLPATVKIVESEHDTANGYRPQWMVKA